MFSLPSSAIWKSLFELLEERMPFIYYSMSRISRMRLRSAEPWPSGLKKLRCNPFCDVDEEPSSDMLSEDSLLTLMMRLILKLKENLRVMNQVSKFWKVRVRVKQVFCVLMGGKT
jgi:hypothetical protein